MSGGQTKLSLGGHNQLKVIDGVFLIKDINVKDFVDKFGTPTYLFHLDMVADSTKNIMNVFKKVFSPKILTEKEYSDSCQACNVQPRGFYSVKSNYIEPVLQSIKNEGFGFEILSEPELNQLIKMAVDPKLILCGGPYFPVSLMKKALEYGIEEYVIYDLEDLKRLNSNAEQLGLRVKVILRFIQYKHVSRNGISLIDESFEILKQISQTSKNIEIIGILNHYGSQLNSVEVYRSNAEFLVDVANQLKDKSNIICKVFNIGGGFPESFVFPDTHFISYLQEMKKYFSENNWGNVNIYYEPGRYIVGGAGFLFSTIVRRNNHLSTLYFDVGTNIIPKFARTSIRFHNIDKIDCPIKSKFDIMGIIPSDQDILAKNYNFESDSQEGDRVVISGVGAYTLTFSNRFPYAFPSIIVSEKGEFRIFRGRGDSRDIAIN